jgi:hypothetical protein
MILDRIRSRPIAFGVAVLLILVALVAIGFHRGLRESWYRYQYTRGEEASALKGLLAMESEAAGPLILSLLDSSAFSTRGRVRALLILRDLGPAALPVLKSELASCAVGPRCVEDSKRAFIHESIALAIGNLGEAGADALPELIAHAEAELETDSNFLFGYTSVYMMSICNSLGLAGFDAAREFLLRNDRPMLQVSAFYGLVDTGLFRMALAELETVSCNAPLEELRDRARRWLQSYRRGVPLKDERLLLEVPE